MKLHPVPNRATCRALWALFLLASIGCGDIGDSSAVPPCGNDGGGAVSDVTMMSADTGAPVRATGSEASASDAADAATEAAVSDDGYSNAADSTVTGSSSGSENSSGSQDSTVSNTNSTDSTVAEVGISEAGTDSTVEAGPADSGTPDSGGPETSENDSSIRETGQSEDTGALDTGESDAVASDTGQSDSSAQDTGGGGSVTACTSSPCASSGPNSAQCSDKTNGVCTATEAIVINYDIAKNGQGPGQTISDPTKSCYTCMIQNACLDATGTANGLGTAVTNAECGDPNGANDNPPFDTSNASGSNVPACLDALVCVVTGGTAASPTSAPYMPTDCTTSENPSSVSNCFCGTATGSACIASSSAPVGVCASRLYTDLGTTDPTTALAHFTDPNNPGGVGTAVLNCALTANCNSCFK